jgi:hypothetical protein
LQKIAKSIIRLLLGCHCPYFSKPLAVGDKLGRCARIGDGGECAGSAEAAVGDGVIEEAREAEGETVGKWMKRLRD